MLISEYIEVKLDGRNYESYSLIVENSKIGDIISLNIKDLNIYSKLKVDVCCDYCQTIYKITYSNHIQSTRYINKHACKKCSFLKRKESNLVRLGVENPMQLDHVKEKFKQTNLQRHGTEHALQSDEFKNKVKKTLLQRYNVENPMQSDFFKNKSYTTNLLKYGFESPSQSDVIKDKIKKTVFYRYGVEYLMQSDEFKEKAKQSNLEKYGFEYPMSSEEIQEKAKQTNLEKYGSSYIFQIDKFKEKAKQSNLEKYGFEYPMASKEIQEKAKQTNLEKYGYDSYTKTNEFKNRVIESNRIKYGCDFISRNEYYRKEKFDISKDENYIQYLGDRISLFKCINGHNFEIHYDNYKSRTNQNIPSCTVCNPIGDLVSIKEKELFNYIKSIYFGEVIQSYRDGLEIDIYLPELKLGFEFNGLYWHSEIYKDKNYHLNKTNHFKEKGIRIIHIWEDDWDLKSDIIKSQVKNLVGKSIKIFARKCIVKEVSGNVCRDFLKANHIQGYYKQIKKSIGLYYKDELISIMTFDQFEGRNKMNVDEWNLSRFCNKVNYSVIGGASRLLKCFIEYNKAIRIVSYADKDWSVGDLYRNLGFIKVIEIKPDYKYLIENKRIHKSKYRRSITGISESDLGLTKIWNCGKIKFEFKISLIE